MSDISSYEDQVNSEYLEEMQDVLKEIDVIMEQVVSGNEEGRMRYKVMLGKINGLMNMGRHTDFPLLNLTTHRLHNYFQGLDNPKPENLIDIQNFSDILSGILNNSIVNDGFNYAEFVRSLPVRRPADLEDIAHLDVEVMVVETQRSSARIFERELMACGYRVSWVKSPLEALAFSIKTQPDMVMASMELEEMSGIDLSCALAAISATKDIPFALLTSYKSDDPKLANLPKSAVILNKGTKFGEDLANVLEHFAIT